MFYRKNSGRGSRHPIPQMDSSFFNRLFLPHLTGSSAGTPSRNSTGNYRTSQSISPREEIGLPTTITVAYQTDTRLNQMSESLDLSESRTVRNEDEVTTSQAVDEDEDDATTGLTTATSSR